MQINIGNNVINRPFPPFPQPTELNLCTLPTDDPPITSRASENPPTAFQHLQFMEPNNICYSFLGFKKK